MGSVTASRAAVYMGVSEMPLKFTCGTSFRSAPSRPATFNIVALFSKKKAAPPPKAKTGSPVDEELAKWYGTYFYRVRLFLYGILTLCFNYMHYM